MTLLPPGASRFTAVLWAYLTFGGWNYSGPLQEFIDVFEEMSWRYAKVGIDESAFMEDFEESIREEFEKPMYWKKPIDEATYVREERGWWH